MNKIDPFIFPLRCPDRYSLPLQQKAQEALGHLLPPEVLAQNPDIKIYGHKVEIADRQFWFEPGTKKIYRAPEFDANGRFVRGEEVAEKTAKVARQAIKELSQHAWDLNAGRSAGRFSGLPLALVRSCPAQTSLLQKTALKMDCIAPKIITYLFPIADLIGVIRNLIDLIQIIGAMAQSSWFVQMIVVGGREISQSALILGECIAAFRVVQGCLALLIGTSKLYLAVKAYRCCKENHDAAGLAIARDQIRGAVLNIVTGLFWVSIGILVLTCPQALVAATTASLVLILLQWILFYGLFTTDSVLALKMANKNIQCIDQRYWYLFNGILNNEHLSLDQMNGAAKRFLKRITQVSDIEKQKMSEKLCKILGHDPLPSQILLRMHQKHAKKCADLSRAMGFDFASAKHILASPDPVSRILEGFETTRSQQDSSRWLSILCLVINFLGFQCDSPTVAEFFKIDHLEIVRKIINLLQFGLGTRSCAIINDGGWVAVNALYSGEDLPGKNLISRIFKKIGPQAHRNTIWWRQLHPAASHSK